MEEKYKNLLQKADAWIEAHKEEFITELRGMVQIPSVSRADLAEPGAPFGPDCRKMLDYSLERGRAYGFDTADHDGYAGSVCLGDMDNALGIIAHMDVVPVGDGWIYPPFEGTYVPEQDVMIGRGVGDNKGPAVAGLFAMRMLRDFGWPLRHGIRLICGCSEETGMQDMTALRDSGMAFPKLSLVPDGSFPVNYGQKGSIGGELAIPCGAPVVSFEAGSVRNVVPDRAVCVLALDEAVVRAALDTLDPQITEAVSITGCAEGTTVSAVGRAAHAAGPGSGISAIFLLSRALSMAGILHDSAAHAMQAVWELTKDPYGISEGADCRDEISGELTLVYGVAHLCDGTLTLSIDSRCPILMDVEEIAGKLQAYWTEQGFGINRLSTGKAFYIPKDDPKVTALMELYTEVTGRNDPPYTMGGGTYSKVVPNAITFGSGLPGGRSLGDFLPEGHGGAHSKDEVVCMDKLHVCAKLYVAALAMLDALVD